MEPQSRNPLVIRRRYTTIICPYSYSVPFLYILNYDNTLPVYARKPKYLYENNCESLLFNLLCFFFMSTGFRLRKCRHRFRCTYSINTL